MPEFARVDNLPKEPRLEECVVDCTKLTSSGDLNQLFEGSDTSTDLNPNSRLAEDLTSRMKEAYEQWGVVLLRNTGLTDEAGTRGNAARMEKIADLIFPEGPEEYTGGSNFRGQVEAETNVYDTGAPHTAHLHYHHEMQYVNRSPKNITFLALAVPNNPQTGITYVSYNPSVTHDLLQVSLSPLVISVCTLSARRNPKKIV